MDTFNHSQNNYVLNIDFKHFKKFLKSVKFKFFFNHVELLRINLEIEIE